MPKFFIHEDSEECIKSELALFPGAPAQTRRARSLHALLPSSEVCLFIHENTSKGSLSKAQNDKGDGRGFVRKQLGKKLDQILSYRVAS